MACIPCNLCYCRPSAFKRICFCPAQPGAGGYLESEKLRQFDVAKTSIKAFFRQVRSETNKVAWPSRAETVQTTIMVMIMAAVMALFFLVVDKSLEAVVKFLLGLLK